MGKTEDDLKDDGKDEYGLWLLVTRKKTGPRVGGLETPIKEWVRA